VFFGLHQKHPASGWLEGITVERFGVLKGDFGIEDISEEILNCLPFITPLVVFLWSFIFHLVGSNV
jgi:hypothetical protein